MSNIVYPSGVPCWVETLQADPESALAFYSGLFGWEAIGPGPMPSGGKYFVARVGGRHVAGIGTLQKDYDGESSWMTYVRVDDADAATARATNAGASVVAPPYDAHPAGRGAVLADPDGAVFGVWQPHDRQGAQLVNASSAWAMSILRTRDAKRSQTFYEYVFGWNYQKFGEAPEEMTLCRQLGYVGGTEQQPVPRDVVAVMAASDDGSRASWNVGFWVDDADAVAARVRELSGRVLKASYDTPGFRQAVVADREGATFSISQLMKPKV